MATVSHSNPVNIIAGFKKCGVYPLNPGEVTDRQIAPSNIVCSVKKSDGVRMSPPGSPRSSTDHEALFQKYYEEGYDIFDEEYYVAWLHHQHPESVPTPYQGNW